MERCGFFDAYLAGEDYDRVYQAQHFAAYFASFINNGVFAQHADQLQVVAMPTPAMQVTVRKGQGWINGYWYENTDELYLPIEVADGVLHRIDSVVLRFGTAERTMWLVVKKGVPAVSNPVKPELTRNADYYELQLATVSIPASSINITQARITDTRLDTNVCGWVAGVVDQIDTTGLFAQYNSAFEAWFQSVQGIMEGDVAANLVNQTVALQTHTKNIRCEIANKQISVPVSAWEENTAAMRKEAVISDTLIRADTDVDLTLSDAQKGNYSIGALNPVAGSVTIYSDSIPGEALAFVLSITEVRASA